MKIGTYLALCLYSWWTSLHDCTFLRSLSVDLGILMGIKTVLQRAATNECIRDVVQGEPYLPSLGSVSLRFNKFLTYR